MFYTTEVSLQPKHNQFFPLFIVLYRSLSWASEDIMSRFLLVWCTFCFQDIVYHLRLLPSISHSQTIFGIRESLILHRRPKQFYCFLNSSFYLHNLGVSIFSYLEILADLLQKYISSALIDINNSEASILSKQQLKLTPQFQRTI